MRWFSQSFLHCTLECRVLRLPGSHTRVRHTDRKERKYGKQYERHKYLTTEAQRKGYLTAKGKTGRAHRIWKCKLDLKEENSIQKGTAVHWAVPRKAQVGVVTVRPLKYEGPRPHHVNVEEEPENGWGLLVFCWVSSFLSEPFNVSEAKNYMLYPFCTSRKLIFQQEDDSGLKEQLLRPEMN